MELQGPLPGVPPKALLDTQDSDTSPRKKTQVMDSTKLGRARTGWPASCQTPPQLLNDTPSRLRPKVLPFNLQTSKFASVVSNVSWSEVWVPSPIRPSKSSCLSQKIARQTTKDSAVNSTALVTSSSVPDPHLAARSSSTLTYKGFDFKPGVSLFLPGLHSSSGSSPGLLFKEIDFAPATSQSVLGPQSSSGSLALLPFKNMDMAPLATASVPSRQLASSSSTTLPLKKVNLAPTALPYIPGVPLPGSLTAPPAPSIGIGPATLPPVPGPQLPSPSLTKISFSRFPLPPNPNRQADAPSGAHVQCASVLQDLRAELNNLAHKFEVTRMGVEYLRRENSQLKQKVRVSAPDIPDQGSETNIDDTMSKAARKRRRRQLKTKLLQRPMERPIKTEEPTRPSPEKRIKLEPL